MRSCQAGLALRMWVRCWSAGLPSGRHSAACWPGPRKAYSGALVLRGEAEVGKTALLDETVAAAVTRGMQTARLTGGGAGDAAGLRRAAPVPAPVRRSPGAAARPAAGRAAEHVRAGRRAACGPVPGRAGGADAASRSPNPRCSTCPASPPSSSTTAIPRAHPPRPLPSLGPILLDHCHPSGRWTPPRPLCSEEDDRLLAFVYI